MRILILFYSAIYYYVLGASAVKQMYLDSERICAILTATKH